MLPIGTLGRTKFRPYVTFFLLIANVLAFLYQTGLALQGGEAILNFLFANALNVCSVGVEPASMIARNSFVSMFLHADIFHLGFNMLFLWIFGPRVEAYFGHRWFFIFYVGVGFLATFAHVLLGGVSCSPDATTPSLLLGASGAIAGTMGAFLFLHPGARVRTVYVFQIPFIPALRRLMIPYRIVYLPAWFFLIFWVLNDVIQLLIGNPSNVAHWAHIGGFVSGGAIVFMTAMFLKPVPKADPLQYFDD